MEVGFYATLRPIVGRTRVEVPLASGATVRALLEALFARWPALRPALLSDDGRLARGVNVFVDGRSVRWLPDGLDTPLADVQQVDLFPAVAGGAPAAGS